MIAGVFVLTWVVALAIWRFGKIEQKWYWAARIPAPADPAQVPHARRGRTGGGNRVGPYGWSRGSGGSEARRRSRGR